MSLFFYFDVHVPSAIAKALRRRGVDVLTAQEDGTTLLPDVELLDRATELTRVLVTRDDDFLAEGSARQRRGEFFAGIIYSHQLDAGIGRCLEDLEIIAKCLDPEDFFGRIDRLPLK